jgi:ribosomal-protein-alanine N-acetyltransferase
MDSIDLCETNRLIAERIAQRHFDDLCQMHQDRKVMATLSATGEPLANEETQLRLEQLIDHWERYGFGFWACRDRDSGQFVGRGGLRRVSIDDESEVEVAYAVVSDHWGEGIATEMAELCVRTAFSKLRLPDLVCYTLPTNRASQRVMEKVGFQYERNIIHAGLDHVFYRLRADEAK